MTEDSGANTSGLDFIRTIVAEDLASGKHASLVTRFPPEPNGYLHVGHAKAICLDFGLALENPGSRCHLRFDDTNPSTEETEYVEGIKEDVRWLGFDWGEHLHFTSDYFEALFDFAVDLIKQGKAFVDDQSAEEIRANQGSLTQAGTDSPFRSRTVEENLELFNRMRGGDFEDGSRVLRAKIDMASLVVAMRDPILYRIQNAVHHRTGDTWCIYPMYDFAHCLSDALEGITQLALHSRVLGPPPPLRLDPRSARNAEQTTADRVRSAERLPHDHKQARSACGCRGGACPRLGRPPNADDRGDAPTRLSRSGDS